MQDFKDYVLELQTQYHDASEPAYLDPAAIRSVERRRLTMLYFSCLGPSQQVTTLTEALEGDCGDVLCSMLTTLVLSPNASSVPSELSQRDVCIIEGIYLALADRISDAIELTLTQEGLQPLGLGDNWDSVDFVWGL